MGIFFAFVMITGVMLCLVSFGCRGDQKAKKGIAPQSEEKSGDFILLKSRANVLEASLNLMKQDKGHSLDQNGLFNMMRVGDEDVPVEIDLENAYASSYNDNRRVVCYPLKNISLPEVDQTKPICFIHYFDEKAMSIFFDVMVGLPTEDVTEKPQDSAFTDSPYQVWFLSPDGKSYGLVKSRILNTSDLMDEEAFRKFSTTRRTILVGTNSLDQNKFLFIFFKIATLKDQIFQIYLRWY